MLKPAIKPPWLYTRSGPHYDYEPHNHWYGEQACRCELLGDGYMCFGGEVDDLNHILPSSSGALASSWVRPVLSLLVSVQGDVGKGPTSDGYICRCCDTRGFI